MIWNQDKYLEAINFAATVHGTQTVPGKPYSYMVHLAQVAQEVMAALANITQESIDADLAVQCALLHDTIEDAEITHAHLLHKFGKGVADGVLALSKDSKLPKEQRMQDSLSRIKLEPREIWMVKLADRIVNLQTPPVHWTAEKIEEYRIEAELIHAQLKEADQFLADRLAKRIQLYARA